MERAHAGNGAGGPRPTLAGLACLRGEPRRIVGEIVLRTVMPAPPTPAQVDCFARWVMRDELAAQLADIGRTSASVERARGLAVDLIVRTGMRPCTTGG